MPLAVGEAPKLEPATQAGSGNVQEKVRAHLREIIEKLSTLFEGDLTEGDQLGYVEVIRDKLLESPVLVQQAAGNLKEQFANSPDLPKELMNALMASFDAHTTMSTQALNSDAVRAGLLDILLNYRGLWEALREKAGAST